MWQTKKKKVFNLRQIGIM